MPRHRLLLNRPAHCKRLPTLHQYQRPIKTMSQRGHPIEYIEVNNDWVPEYFITYQSEARDFFDECAKQFEIIRQIGPPPKGLQFSVANKTATSRENQIYRTIDSPVDISVSWMFWNPEIEAYVGHLKRLFPHWKWWAKPT